MKYTFLILFCFLLFSCEDFFETTLELEEPEFTEQLVVNCIINNLNLDQSYALVSKTIGLNDNPINSYVSDANVNIIYPNGITYNLKHVDISNGSNSSIPFNYQGQLPDLQPNEEYKIEVTQSEKTVTSTVKMPPNNKLISALYLENGGLDNDGNDVSAIDILIDDSPDEVNYYKIAAIKELNVYDQPLYLSSNNAFAIQSTTYSDILINDDQFNGQQFKLRLLFHDFDNEELGVQEYKVIMKSISKEQYDHDRILSRYFDNIENPFASPVQISSNIEGGLGLFALENITIYDVEE